MSSESEKRVEPDYPTLQGIIHNYLESERSMVNQLFYKHEHGSTIGGFREDLWKELFEQLVPKKFVVEQSVFIMDSNGQVSKEVDLAIIDEQYTPYIFRKGRLKFIPIEAVAVAVECKSTSASYKALVNWTESIQGLRTSRNATARMYTNIVTEQSKSPFHPTQTSTRPILIYCYKGRKQSAKMELFDFSLRAHKNKGADSGDIFIYRKKELESLQDWYRSLNHVQVEETDEINQGETLKTHKLDCYKITYEDQEVSLLSFNFQLNQLLMLINNPLLFPHKAYVEMFNNMAKK